MITETILILLAVVFFIIGEIYYFKIYVYIKKNRPTLLKSLTIPVLTFLPEFYRYNPLNLIPFIFNVSGEKDPTIKRYKFIHALSISLTIILFVIWFISISY